LEAEKMSGFTDFQVGDKVEFLVDEDEAPKGSTGVVSTLDPSADFIHVRLDSGLKAFGDDPEWWMWPHQIRKIED
jgi:hypothetical protein